ncbi:SdpI family protein [Shouchella sp. JSM 1781072]|uniref:SdpI family protein n=1 Tax=Bacillaceae TaxID=186817 RepID=UPI0020CFF4CA|nr:SdpI family protein [Alkalihalobacillus sp. LMS6]UTR06737.1 SdpI family protein [Alkalihalobacillus sp. LMS6]
MKNYWVTLSIFFLAILVSLFTWPYLDQELAIQWQNGETSATVPRWLGVLTMPAVMILVITIFAVFLRFDPNRDGVSCETRSTIITLFMAVFFGGHILILLNGLGVEINEQIYGGLIIGSLCIVLGNIMPKVRMNHTVGLRTTWTLKNKTVWELSNRFTGRLFFAAGLVILPLAIPLSEYYVLIATGILLCVAVIGVLHSYIKYQQIVSKS